MTTRGDISSGSSGGWPAAPAEDIKVLIVNEEGQYLSGTATHWEFTDDRSRARVFDYLQDHVAEQLQLVRNAYRSIWIAVQLDPRETYEFCDRCGGRMTALQARYNGANFLCPSCLAQPSSVARS